MVKVWCGAVCGGVWRRGEGGEGGSPVGGREDLWLMVIGFIAHHTL